MKILCISDTHNIHRDLDVYLSEKTMEKNGIDTLIHCGDFTNDGTYDEIKDFVEWFGSVPVKNKVLIAGNHEITLDPYKYNANPHYYIKEEERRVNSDKTIGLIADAVAAGKFVYLENSVKVIDGIKFFGSPFSLVPPYTSTALGFQYNDIILNKIWESIPDDTDVVMTHTPPFGILDNYGKHYRGSEALRHHITQRVKPSLHVFGHVHARNGHEEINGTMFVNAVCVNGKRKVKYQPFLVEI